MLDVQNKPPLSRRLAQTAYKIFRQWRQWFLI